MDAGSVMREGAPLEGETRCISCGVDIDRGELHQICRRYRRGQFFAEVYRCEDHFLVYDLEWGPDRGWFRAEIDRANYVGGTENYGQGYSWESLPDGRIDGASFCKSCGRVLDFGAHVSQVSILVRGEQILDVLCQCHRHW